MDPFRPDRKIELPHDVVVAIRKRDLAALEADWLARLDASTLDIPLLLTIAGETVRVHEPKRAADLLELLADACSERDDHESLARVQRALAVLRPNNHKLGAAIEDTLRRLHGGEPGFAELLAHAALPTTDNIPEALAVLDTWRSFPPKQGIVSDTRGSGRIREAHPDTGTLVVDFEVEKGVTMKVDAVRRLLQRLPDGHFLLRRVDDPDFKQNVLAKPGEATAAFLQSVARPAPVLEIKHAMRGAIPDDKWAKWWTAARKNSAVKQHEDKMYVWVDPASALPMAEVNAAALDARAALVEARARIKKKQDVGDDLLEALIGHAREAVVAGEAGLAFELADVVERGAAQWAERLTHRAPDVIAQHDPVDVIGAIEDRTARETAIEHLRRQRDDWSAHVISLFMVEDDARTLAVYERALRAHAPEEMRRLAQQILRTPRRNPRAFIWMVKQAANTDELRDLLTPGVLTTVLDGLADDTFRTHRTTLKQLLDARAFTTAVYERATPEDAKRIRTAIDRAAGLEEYRRTPLVDELLAHFPSVTTAPQVEVIFVTREAADRRRQELETITSVQIPAAAAALGKAAALGDLKENHDYKAAREKHENLTSRAQSLLDELARVRVIEPEHIETTRVAIGTRVRLEGPNGDVRLVSLLGPWDTRLEENIYSYLSPLGQALLGQTVGARVTVFDAEHTIREIERAI